MLEELSNIVGKLLAGVVLLVVAVYRLRQLDIWHDQYR